MAYDSRTRIVDLAGQLVARSSVSAEGNNRVIGVLDPILTRLGFHVERYAGDHSNTCLIARLGGKEVREDGLAIVIHTDTIPYKLEQEEGRWGDCNPLGEIATIQNEERLYGRGTVDVKASLAAALVASEQFVKERLKRPFAFIFTYGEEVGHTGAKYLLNHGLLSPSEFKHAIVVEPTSLRPAIAHPGMEETVITIRGPGGHGSRPHLGINANYPTARIISALEDLGIEFQKEEYRCQGSDDLYTVSLNAGKMEGGEAMNTLAEKAQIWTQARQIFIPGKVPVDVHKLIREMAEKIAGSYGLEAKVDLVRSDPDFKVTSDAEIVRFLQELAGQSPIIVPYSSEALEMHQAGITPVIFGPGRIEDAHRPLEFVSIDGLVAAERVFVTAIREFCMK